MGKLLISSRSFTVKRAKGLGITGYVFNASDGTVSHAKLALTWYCFLPYFQVRGEAQGSEEQLKEFIKHINKGPSHARVTGVEHSEIQTKEDESSFNVE